jgi:hypothetical protein
VKPSDVKGILILNLLKTDYYHAQAYPSYLTYNPYDSVKRIRFDVGLKSADLYDAVSHHFVKKDVRNDVMLTIPADTAMVLVVTPAHSKEHVKDGRLYVNGIVADYRYGESK